MQEQIVDPYVYDLVAFQRNVCCVAQSSGLFRYDGKNLHNVLTSHDVEPFAVTTITQSPDFQHDRTLFAGAAGTLLRSINGGETWDFLALPSPSPVVTAIVLAPDFATSGIVFVGTLEDGVFVSQDRGMHWDVWNFGLIGFGINTLTVSDNSILFAGNEIGVFQSKNMGRSWAALHIFEKPVVAMQVANHGLLVGVEDMGLWLVNHHKKQPIASETLSGTVDTIFLRDNCMLVLNNHKLFLSRDDGITWHRIETALAIISVDVFEGLHVGAEILVAAADSTIYTLCLP